MKYVTVDQGRPSLEIIPSDCPKKVKKIYLVRICEFALNFLILFKSKINH